MTAIKIIRLLHLTTYLVVATQLMYYVFLMGDAMKMIGIGNFVEQRKVVDPLVHLRHVPFYYATLILSLLLVALMYRQWNTVVFVTIVISTLLLVADIYLGIKLNGPINTFINQHGMDTAADWEGLRTKWIYYIKVRGVLSMSGFLVLLAGLVFQGAGNPG